MREEKARPIIILINSEVDVNMQNASFFRQTHVYFKKITRISIREKAWIYLLFAFIIAMIVNLVTASNMFDNLDDTKSGFFTLASACIWIGVFNSIQSICKEHNIIRSEYRQGAKLSSYVCAHILWQAVLCFVQCLIIFIISCKDYHTIRCTGCSCSTYDINSVSTLLSIYSKVASIQVVVITCIDLLNRYIRVFLRYIVCKCCSSWCKSCKVSCSLISTTKVDSLCVIVINTAV